MEDSKAKQFWLYPFLLVSVALLVALGFLVGDIFSGPPETETPTPTPAASATPPQEPTATIITGPGILRRIESTMKLQTTVFRIDTVVRAKKEGKTFLNLGGQNLLLFVRGTVTAGVDLSELNEKHIEVSQESKTIVITLPPAKILGAALDDYEVEDYSGEKPESVDLALLEEGLSAGREQIEATACTDKILERATIDAEQAYKQMISFVDFTDYEVVVKSSQVGECAMEVKMAVQP
jgi:hypothetical protein